MRLLIVDLSVDEAADSRIVQNIVNAIGQGPTAPFIRLEDRPDVGAPLPEPPVAARPIIVPGPLPKLVPVAAPAPAPEPTPDPAVIFGGQAAAVPPAPQSTPALSAAAAAPTPTAPVAEASSTTPAAPVATSPAAMPVPPAAPASAALPTPPVTSGVDVDNRGLPWDHRIHAGTKAKNKDGSWRQKRETKEWLAANPGKTWDSFVESVESELRAVLNLPAPAAAIPAAPSSPAVPSATKPAFGDLMLRVQAAVTSGRIAVDWVNQRAAQHGVESLPLMMMRPDIVDAVWNELRAVAPAVFEQ